jgi:hypothetical protein
MSEFHFGRDAIVPAGSQSHFNERRDSIIDSVRPANMVESIMAEELLHASWELERLRACDPAVAPPSAHSRASRNWHRSLKQLKTLQSARASHFSHLYETAERDLGEQFPLADIKKLPKPIRIPTEGK